MQALKAVASSLLLVISSDGFSATAAKHFVLNDWVGSAQFTAGTKQFSQCVAVTKNEKGIAITISVDRRFIWKIAFSSGDWSLSPGHSINANLKIGKEDYYGQRAVVVDSNTMELRVDNSIALFERVRTGQLLRIEAGALILAFPLIGVDEVLSALVQCVTEHVARTNRQKISGTKSQKPLQLIPSSELTGEAQSLASNILTQIGLTDIKFASPKNVMPWYPAQAAWQRRGISGAVAILGAEETIAPEQIPLHLLNNIGRACRGRFFLIATSDATDDAIIQRTFTSCRWEDGMMSSYFFTAPRAAGGLYQIATMFATYDAQRPAELMDNEMRAIARGVIAKQGNAGPAKSP